MASEKSYPIPYFRDGYHPKYAHGLKDEKDFAKYNETAEESDKWHADPRNIPHQPYPRLVYDVSGGVQRIEQRDKQGKIDLPACEALQAQLVAQGYSLKPVAEKPVVRQQSTSPNQAHVRVDELEERLAKQQDQIDQLIAALTAKAAEPAVPGKGKKSKASEDEDRL